MPQEQRQLKQLDIVGVLDPARSRESEYKLASRHAIVVTGMDWESNIFVLHTWAKRTDLNELLLEAQNVCQLFPTMRCFGVESVAAQIVIKDVIAEWLRLNRILVPTVELKPDTRMTKKWRIRMQIQRPATQGKLHLQESQHDLRTELFGFPHSRTIDLVDALGYCVSLHYPPEEWEEIKDWSPAAKSNLQKMIDDGRLPEMPKRPQANEIPYGDLFANPAPWPAAPKFG
jgi:hypothetical protein